MELPEGYKIDNHVARFNRCIYGLKQSPREWYFRLIEYIKPLGFISSEFDPCVLLHSSGNLIAAIYVDDIVLFGEQGALMEDTVNLLKSEFKVNDMGTLHWLLGIQIGYIKNGSITLSQTAYIDRILNRFSMNDCNSTTTPLENNQRLMAADDGEPRVDAKPYQQIIGSVMYLATGTRPDLAYTITHLSQYNIDPSVTHMNAAKRVLRYIRDTRSKIDLIVNIPPQTQWLLRCIMLGSVRVSEIRGIFKENYPSLPTRCLACLSALGFSGVVSFEVCIY
ncbi:hypothetical protein K3495_g8007 [Podosphaera aphanis]|nr:hypothetical protein K3495_g8007 [Podosphaera aphanis]